MAHVVVLGAGLGGIPAAFSLRKHLPRTHPVPLVGERPYFDFMPSKPWVVVGWRKPEDRPVTMHDPLESKGIQWRVNSVTGIDAAASTLTLEDGADVQFEYVVIATGPKLAIEEVPGLRPDRYTQSACSQDHSARAHDQYQEFLKKPGPIVVGAAAGAGCTGPAYETELILDAELLESWLRGTVPMTYVTSEPDIGHLGLGGVGDSKRLLESELRERPMKWATNAKIVEVREKDVPVRETDEAGALSEDHVVPCSDGAIIPAFRDVDAVVAGPMRCNPRGFVVIDKHQRNSKMCKQLTSWRLRGHSPGRSHSRTGRRAEYRSRERIHGIGRGQQHRRGTGCKPVVAEATWNAICLVDIGDTGAAFAALPQFRPRIVTWAKRGARVRLTNVAFEKDLMRTVRTRSLTPADETYVVKALGTDFLKDRID